MHKAVRKINSAPVCEKGHTASGVAHKHTSQGIVVASQRKHALDALANGNFEPLASFKSRGQLLDHAITQQTE